MTSRRLIHPSVFRRALTFGAAWVMAFALLSGQGIAAPQGGDEQKATDDFTVKASLSQTGSWSSNPLMVVDGAKPLWKSTTSPEIVFKKTTPLSLIDVHAGVDENITNRPAFDSTDLNASVSLSTRNERWKASLRKQINYDTTRTSELTNYGLLPVVSRHLGLSIAPRVSFSPTAKDTVSVAGSFARSDYESDIFTDYDTYSASSSYERQFDPLNTGIFSIQAQRYQTTRDDAARIDSMGPSLGWQMILSPQFVADASVGIQASRQYNYGVAVNDWTLQHVFSGGLSFKGEQDDLRLSTARAQFPQGNGTQALQTSVALSEVHKLSPLVSLKFGVGYRASEYQTTSVGNLESLANGHIGGAYHATEDLDLTIDYKYRYETLTNSSNTVQDNAVTVGLAYSPDAWALFQ